jgi:cell division protein FtsL
VVKARPAPSRLPGLSVRRLAALGVLAVVAALYVSPVQKYLRVQREVRYQNAELARAEQRHDALIQERTALDTNQRIILLARECGWIFPGERALVIEGLPVRTGASCR